MDTLSLDPSLPLERAVREALESLEGEPLRWAIVSSEKEILLEVVWVER
jgi:hypothetical protein